MSYWHNPATGVCQPVEPTGCGSPNDFATLEWCQSHCHGGEPDLDVCSGPGDCVLVSAGCCSDCGAGDARSFVAVARAAPNRYRDATRCQVSCGACGEVAEEERTSQYYVAECRASRCVVSDVRTTSLTACTEDVDCGLRDGLGCCAECDGHGLVALNRAVDTTVLTCGNGPIPSCAPCPSAPPETYRPRCVAGRCTVVATR